MMKLHNHKTEALCWWLLLLMLYLSLLSSLSTAEIIAGVAVATLVAVVAVYARAAEQMTFRIRLRWCRWLPALLFDLLADVGPLAALLFYRSGTRSVEQGRVYRIEFPPEPDPRAAHARRAIAAVLLSATPGSYVVDSRTGKQGADMLTIHCVGGQGRLAQAMRR